MSEDRIFNTRNKPRRNIVRDVLQEQNTVRVYRSSPENVTLQLRRVTDYISIGLSFAEARDIAAALLEACGDISPLQAAYESEKGASCPSQ